jgi:hypothetical protein
VSRESTLQQAHLTDSERPKAGFGRWQWIFPILIVAGMILIGVSVFLLLRDAAGSSAPDAYVWMPRL